jgi:hypothetical protein
VHPACILPSSLAEAKRVWFCLQQRIFIRCEHKVNHHSIGNVTVNVLPSPTLDCTSM